MDVAIVQSISGETMQEVLQILGGISVLLTLQAVIGRTWMTMWLAALVSLTASLMAIWSFGSLIFLLTCMQVAAAVAIRRASSARESVALLLAGVITFGLLVYGLAFLRLWELWVVAFPLAVLAWSVFLHPRLLPRHQRPLTPSTP